ncbi:5-formyltetrahydrofolate cyclo-ligase [Leucobacter albus]|uniref:5-formyltetrahydrofolate cyclo-ligase n=1 Tax=Leucobacter albus TaxID=272210 RepID=A0ABW3TMV9_9MICO
MDDKRRLRSAIRAARVARAALAADLAGELAATHGYGKSETAAQGHDKQGDGKQGHDKQGVDQQGDANGAITANLVALTERSGAQRVSCFVGVAGEPDTSEYLRWASGQGIEVLLPRVLPGDLLEWVPYRPDCFAIGAFGIPEPTGPASPEGAADAAELLFVPAAAVDLQGNRLGWGRGFFDRELARLAGRGDAGDDAGGGACHRTPQEVYAVVWESEVLDTNLPTEAHDVAVHGAVTEARIHHFG